MIVFPAIDLKGGDVVRLAEGDMDRATIYGDNPAVQAMRFADEGAEFLHVVDLDGSFAGRTENREAVEAILADFPGHVQLGGGIRDAAGVESWFNLGVSRVVMASLLFTDIGRDGLLKGVNIDATVELARQVDIPVIASGGVKGLDDIHILALHAGEGIEGVITGRALYEGKLDLAAAIAMGEAA